jgi:DNA-binding transcriptional ArsR family regulator
MPNPDVIIEAEVSTISIALEPAFSALNSLMLLNKLEHLSGLSEWVYATAAKLTQEQLFTNKIVLWGLFYAVEPERSWSSFEAYVDHLAALDPLYMRDKVLEAYAGLKLNAEGDHSEHVPGDERGMIDFQPILDDLDAFITFLEERFSADSIDLEIERESHYYLNHPTEMRSLIVTHLREMWETVLAPEWVRVKPMLQASANAFRSIDLTQYSTQEAVELVLNKELDECMTQVLEEYERIVLVPSAHLGPYSGKFGAGKTLWLLFGVRMPEGAVTDSAELSRSDLLVRLNALADDSRLRVLRLLFEEGELRSQDIMTKLDLSQSAASRHLKQLSATGYIKERRCTGAKCYTLNPARIQSTLNAVSAFLLEE